MTAVANSMTKQCLPQGRRVLAGSGLLCACLCGFVWLASGRAEAQGILTITPGRTAATVAGTGTAGYSGDGSAGTSAALFNPSGAVYDAAGNLYVSDARNNVVRMIAAGSGTITTVAGSGAQGYAGDGGAATAAALDQPMGLALDAGGNLYIADSHNHVVREVSGGTITTVAGTGVAGFSGDSGAATAALLDMPEGVAVDASGNLYIADTLNQRVRKVVGGTITTIAGTGVEAYAGDGGAASAASLDLPAGLAVDASGSLYIADSHNQTVREIVASGGNITTVAGSGTAGFAGDGGAATAAALALPLSVALDAAGNVYVADSLNHRVREVANGSITTIAGSGVQSFSGDAGLATAASLDTPRAVAPDASGNLAVADTLNQRVRLMALPVVAFGSQAAGTTSTTQTVALGNMGTASLVVSALTVPSGFAVSGGSCSAVPIMIAASGSCSVGLVYSPTAVGAASGSITASGSGVVPQTLLVSGTGVQGTKTITFPQPVTPQSVGVSATMTATASGGDPVTYTITAGTATVSGSTVTYTTAGAVTIQASSAATANYAAATPVSRTVTVTKNYIWVENATGTLVKVSESGSGSGVLGTAGTASTRGGLAFDASGNAWSVSTGTNALDFITTSGTGATVYSGGGLNAPAAVAVDGAGYIWVANSGGNTVSAFTNAGVARSSAAGYGTNAGLNAPSAVAIDTAGGVWVVSKTGNSVTHIFGAASPVVTPIATATANNAVGTQP